MKQNGYCAKSLRKLATHARRFSEGFVLAVPICDDFQGFSHGFDFNWASEAGFFIVRALVPYNNYVHLHILMKDTVRQRTKISKPKRMWPQLDFFTSEAFSLEKPLAKKEP